MSEETTSKRGRKKVEVNINPRLQTVLDKLNDKYKKPITELVKLVQNEKDIEVLKTLQTNIDFGEESKKSNRYQHPLTAVVGELETMVVERMNELENPQRIEENEILGMIAEMNKKYKINFKLVKE